MDLLTNAVEAIQVGVEDFGIGTRPRLLSAVRSIHAGILLLYKESLRRHSPKNSNEALVKARIEPHADKSGAITFVGVGRKTASADQIRTRLAGLGVETDWKLFAKIADARHDIEHYVPKVSQDAMQGLLSSALVIIRRFIAEELKDDARALLGQATWDRLLAVDDVYQAERSACVGELGNIEWESDTLAKGVLDVRCGACGSDLMHPKGSGDDPARMKLICGACGAIKPGDEFVPEAVEEALSWEAYDAAKEGGEAPCEHCPNCNAMAYVIAEDCCALCGEDAGDRECVRCGRTIPISEMDSAPMCSYCDYTAHKDD